MTAAGDEGPDAHRQLAALPLAVVLLAPGLQIASANPAAEQFFGAASPIGATLAVSASS